MWLTLEWDPVELVTDWRSLPHNVRLRYLLNLMYVLADLELRYWLTYVYIRPNCDRAFSVVGIKQAIFSNQSGNERENMCRASTR